MGLAGLLLIATLATTAVWRLAFSGLPNLPDKAAIASVNPPQGVTFLDRNGEVIAVRGSRHGAALALSELPAYVPAAFLAAEDRRFYSHHGVDLEGLLRAAEVDLTHRRLAQGGSTLTQQLARNLFLTPDQTLRRKLQEAVLAWRIEQVLSKTEILELYLNRTYFGEGAYGVEAASQIYFAKSARNLTLAQAALLAALPKAPSRLDPTNDLDAAFTRARLILSQMRAEGWITATDAARAASSPPKLAPEQPGEGEYGYVLDLAAQRARDLTGNQAHDLIVRLSIDPKLQAMAVGVVQDGVAQGQSQGATEAALVALAPDGAVRAMVGGVRYRDSVFNRATQARRQPGSAFKPFVYAAALEAGIKPQDVRRDSAISYAGYTPENYGGGHAGAMTVAAALARSVNTIAVELTHQVGPDKVAALAQRFGLSMIPSHPSLPIARGAYEVDLLDLVSAYQVFQSGGRRIEPYLIETITSPAGQTLYQHQTLTQPQVFSQDRAAAMVRMMEGVLTGGTGMRAALDRPAAGKTGTSQNWRDAWFIGFTPDWAAGVWVGDDRGRPMAKIAGGELPAEMWRKFMLAAHEGLPPRDFDNLPDVGGPTETRAGGGATVASVENGVTASDDVAGASPNAEPDAEAARDFYSRLAKDLGQDSQGQPDQVSPPPQ